ncbi:hypothetical protein FB476_2386 [Ornithinimicrobium humiphilum]|uniref:Uncharacterized protein n=1 Tax=Ornithinimicrobium humiphilum TaxID=125288 RepID=A0A543KQZ9_9MICO|nr:hypothetical protein FB476_2386 [Ornithinimicrobium humiphilum]
MLQLLNLLSGFSFSAPFTAISDGILNWED